MIIANKIIYKFQGREIDIPLWHILVKMTKVLGILLTCPGEFQYHNYPLMIRNKKLREWMNIWVLSYRDLIKLKIF